VREAAGPCPRHAGSTELAEVRKYSRIMKSAS
jgi:hypothetical protein